MLDRLELASFPASLIGLSAILLLFLLLTLFIHTLLDLCLKDIDVFLI